MNKKAVLFAALLSVTLQFSLASAQTPLQRAAEAFKSAEVQEGALNEKPQAERTRAEYLKVINTYQRTYLITPRSGYSDNALMAIARLYEEINDKAAAIRTLNFLIREYPGSPFKDAAEKDLTRLSGSPEQRTAAIENVRYWEMPDSVRIVVDVAGEVTFKQGEAKSPHRVFIDVTPARLNSLLKGKQWPVKSTLLEQIRVGQYDASTVRVVFDVGESNKVTTMSLHDPDRLIIDVLGTGSTVPAAPATTSVSPQPTAAPQPAAPVRPAAPAAPASAAAPAISAATVAPAATPKPANAPKPDATKPAEPKVITAAKATNDGTRSLVRSLGLKLSRVVIDAGHGGHDTGSIGPTGYAEKELVLDVAMRLKQLVETEMGAEVVMTRTEDTFVPLETRTAIANEQQADLFISIHANSSRVRSVRGGETYFLNFTSSREALETASR